MARNGRPPLGLQLSDEERTELLSRLNSRKGATDEKFRIRIILALAGGESSRVIAERMKTTAQTISKWRRRFEAFRLAGLGDAPRAGRGRRLSDEQVQEVIDRVRQTKPENSTHWSVRQMSEATGVSATSVHRIWRAFVLKPHLQDTFKLSTDPHFVDKVRDVVGLYLTPPDRALVLCVDEKSQIQALNRTAPILPVRPGLPEKATHDYKRNGTTTLFAALEIATGRVVDECYDRHGKAEFGAFLRKVAKAYPRRQLHVVVDNYHTHKHAEIQAWLAKNPRITLHFTPTSGSWLNLVEVFFGIITRQAIRRGSFDSVAQLVTAIRAFIDGWNDRCHPFTWTKTADEILPHATRKRDSDARH